MEFRSLMIGTSDSAKLAEFYEKALDQKPESMMPEWYGFKIGQGYLTIGPHSEVTGTNKEPARIMFNIETDSPKELFTKIKATGAEVVKEIGSPDGSDSEEFLMGTFADPDGNYFQICTKWEEPSK
ncbi:MAG: VOC family protein [Acidimicrobiia bacterium]